MPGGRVASSSTAARQLGKPCQRLCPAPSSPASSRAAGRQHGGSRAAAGLTRQLQVDVEGCLGHLERGVSAVPQAHHGAGVDDAGLGGALLQGRGG